MVGHSQGPGQVAVQFSGQLCDALLHLIRVGERNVMVWKVSHRSAVLRKSGAWAWLGPGLDLDLSCTCDRVKSWEEKRGQGIWEYPHSWGDANSIYCPCAKV
jgi:hypothetical protein